MLLIILTWLTKYTSLHIPAAFSYVSTRMVLSAITTLLFTICLGPWFIKKLYELRIGQPVSRLEDVPALKELHEKKKDTPTMGGILILSGMLLSLLLWMDCTKLQTHLLAGATLVLGIVGGVDDYLKLRRKSTVGLRSRQKFVLQCVIAFVLSGILLAYFPMKGITYYIPFYKYAFILTGMLGGGIFLFVSSFVIVGSSNAVNLTDGLDGLASGLVVMVAVVFALFGFLMNNVHIAEYLNLEHIDGVGEVAVYMCALSGGCLGFLWYNGYPAQIFMGDIGSLTLGGILGLSAVLLRRELLLAIIGGVFVVETMSVIIQVVSYRYRNKKRVFLCAPIHHHFEHKGWPETKVVLRFWIIGLLLAMIGASTIKFQ